MPTYFARRFIRRPEHVGPTEKAIGAFCLLLLVGIVAVFLLQTATNTDYLFDIDPAVLDAPEESGRQLVAKQMLPPLGDAAWEATGPLEALGADALPQAWPEASQLLDSFGVRWVYRRGHQTTEPPRQHLLAMVCDAETPARAFGLWHARRPAESEALNVGRAGWLARDQMSAGFWNGRYYSELHAPAPLAGTLTLPAAASTMASVQLSYGGPFPAENLLPPLGRLPGTFRYVHRNAMGIEALERVFLVDLAGDIVSWVHEAESTEDALAFSRRIEAGAPAPSPARDYMEDAPGGVYGTETPAGAQGPLAVLPWGANVMALFVADRHVHGAYGSDRAGVVASAMSAYMIAGPQLAAEPDAVGDRGAAEIDNPFPQADLADWRAPREVSRYTPDNLYVKINGRAGLYLQYHVVGLTFGTYYEPSDSSKTIDVYWYDMGEPTNALGVYRAEEAPEAAPVSFGREGYQVGGAVFFIKGADYVQVLPSGSEEDDGLAALQIARNIAGRIEGGAEPMWAAEILPAEDRVPDSISFSAEDVFGLDFLTDVFTAEYELDAGRFTLFVHRAADQAAAKSLFDKYVRAFGDYGKVLWQDADPSRPIVAGETGGLIDVVFVKGRYLAGLAGSTDLESARQAASEFFDNLEAP